MIEGLFGPHNNLCPRARQHAFSQRGPAGSYQEVALEYVYSASTIRRAHLLRPPQRGRASSRNPIFDRHDRGGKHRSAVLGNACSGAQVTCAFEQCRCAQRPDPCGFGSSHPYRTASSTARRATAASCSTTADSSPARAVPAALGTGCGLRP